LKPSREPRGTINSLLKPSIHANIHSKP
jgi:hypothetical protein